MSRAARVMATLSLLWISATLASQAHAQNPLTISGISPSSGPVGSVVTITGLNFGSSQGSSTVSLNGTAAVITSWSDTSINVVVPSGATSGTFSVTVDNDAESTAAFTITALPSGWTDSDVGAVGKAGSASYSNGVFTLQGSGTGISGTADEFNFLYLPLSGDGTIVARVASSSSGAQAGVVIRETLNTGATEAAGVINSPYVQSFDRTSTGGVVSDSYNYTYPGGYPYWVKLVRSGSSFSVYYSYDGLYWLQNGCERLTNPILSGSCEYRKVTSWPGVDGTRGRCAGRELYGAGWRAAARAAC